MRELASIQRITDIQPIPNADKIVVATVQGWQVVIKKDEFKVGDLVVYVEVDSVLPEREEFEFMRDRKFRVKTIKLRGQVSQGICFPLSILPKGNYKEGDVVTDILGIKKYDPEGERERKLLEQRMERENNKIKRYLMKHKWYRRLFMRLTDKRASFPSFIKKTDETRIQKLNKMFEIERDNGTVFSYTEKLDGQSATYFIVKEPRRLFGKDRYKFGVCSRNIHLIKPDDSSYWTIARQEDMKNKLLSIANGEKLIVIQGEIIGKGIQGNSYEVDGYDFYVYNIKIGNRLLSNEEMTEVCEAIGLKTVPILGEMTLPPTIRDLVSFAKGYSIVNQKAIREGLVFRNNEKDISFKVISEDYLLKIENKR